LAQWMLRIPITRDPVLTGDALTVALFASN
jgi:hypothetical protein